MNPVLTQLPKAQEAYTAVLDQWTAAGIDTTSQLLEANNAIRTSIAKGYLGAHINGMEEVRVAEKLAIELAELGYNTACVSGGQIQKEDGSIRPVYAVKIDWKFMASNTRDLYTV